MKDLSGDPVDPAIRARYAGKLYKLDPRNPDHGDGREEALQAFIYEHPNISNIRGHPSTLRAAIDQFGIEKDFLMTTGVPKLEIITATLRRTRPRIILELGGYIGWGAVAFGGLLRELHPHATPGEVRLYSFELEPRFAAIANSFVELAGLNDIVQVVIGSAEESLRRLKAEGKLESANAVLIDHWEKFYLNDFQILEELKLIRSGSVIFTDNCVRAPEYLEYVRQGKGQTGLTFKTETVDSIMPMGIKDPLEITTIL